MSRAFQWTRRPMSVSIGLSFANFLIKSIKTSLPTAWRMFSFLRLKICQLRSTLIKALSRPCRWFRIRLRHLSGELSIKTRCSPVMSSRVKTSTSNSKRVQWKEKTRPIISQAKSQNRSLWPSKPWIIMRATPHQMLASLFKQISYQSKLMRSISHIKAIRFPNSL